MANTSQPTFSAQQIGPIDKQLLDSCIHCGLCLPACPTYLATGREMESPRGRIYLLSQWNFGQQSLTPDLTQHIDSCLGCLGCQTACPSGVKYESILNAARPYIAEQRPAAQRNLMRFAFKHVLPDYSLLQVGGFFLRLWQKTGLGKLLQWIAAPTADYARAGEEGTLLNPVRKFFYRLHIWESFLPDVPVHQQLPQDSRADGNAETVQLFAGCVMDVFYNHVNNACVRVLNAEGLNVSVPPQGCCGALAMHAGETDIARELAVKNIELFEKTSGAIVVTAAGCGAMLREYAELFPHGSEWHDRARAIAARCNDITEAAAGANLPSTKVSQAQQSEKTSYTKVAYHSACHLAHAQGVRQAPEQLLDKVANDLGSDRMKLIPLREAEHCCGSAGIYNLLNTEMSMQVLSRKMEFLKQTGADVVVTTNPGCMMQLEKGAKSFDVPIKVMHMAELLDKVYVSHTDIADTKTR